jgi:hypothetical protein
MLFKTGILDCLFLDPEAWANFSALPDLGC